MTLENLKRARIIFPGVIGIVVALGFFIDPFDPDQLSSVLSIITGVVYLIIAIIFGGVYDVIGLRWLVLEASHNRIDNNIKLRLVEPFKNDPKMSGATERLFQGRNLLNIFYRFVDNDNSLTQRSKEVYFNGLMWTTLADVIVICSIGMVFYIFVQLLEPRAYRVAIAVFLFVAAVLACVLLPLVEKKHIEYGTRQVDYIILHYRNELYQKLLEVAGT